MKQLILFSLSICFLFVSCSKEQYSGVEDTPQYSDLKEDLTLLVEWTYVTTPAAEDLVFETLETQATGGCPVTTAAIQDNPDLDPPLFREFVSRLDMRSVRNVHDWFVDYGRTIYDLKIEYKADDAETFVNELSTRLIKDLGISDCRINHIMEVNWQAYLKGSYYGITFSGAAQPDKCSGQLLYGSSSSFTKVVEFIRNNGVCNT